MGVHVPDDLAGPLWVTLRTAWAAGSRDGARLRPGVRELLESLRLAALQHTMSGMSASAQPDSGFVQTGAGDTARAALVMELSTTEAAHRHGVTPATIRRWAAAGQIPARRHGRDWLIREESA